MDRGAWWAVVHRIPKSWTQLKQLSKHARKIKAIAELHLPEERKGALVAENPPARQDM